MPSLKKTPNYELNQWEGNEYPKRQDFVDDNMKIDQALTPTADPSQIPEGNGPVKLVQWVSWFANRIKAITGKSNWYDAPDTTLAAVKSHIDAAAPHTGHETPAGAQAKVDAHEAKTSVHGATSEATANRIMIRDNYGRAKVAAPSASDDIARKAEVDTVQANLTGHAGTAASMSAFGHVIHAVLTATLDTTWSGSTAPYTKTITVNGITTNDTPIIDVIMSGTYATDQNRAEAWGYIYRAVTGNNQITFYAMDKPTVALPIQVRVVR